MKIAGIIGGIGFLRDVENPGMVFLDTTRLHVEQIVRQMVEQ